MQFAYHINLDERGQFEADVRNPFDKSVFAISGRQIFEDGFMKDKHDVAGLQAYLRDLKIISPTDTIKDMEKEIYVFDRKGENTYVQKRGRVYRSSLMDNLIGEKMGTGGGFSKHLRSPEQLLNNEPIRNLHHRKVILGDSNFNEGGLSGVEIENLIEDYEPEFQYFEKSDVAISSDDKKHEKKYIVHFDVPRDVFDRIEHLKDYRDQAIEHFKNFGKSKGIEGVMYDITTNDKLQLVAEITQII